MPPLLRVLVLTRPISNAVMAAGLPFLPISVSPIEVSSIQNNHSALLELSANSKLERCLNEVFSNSIRSSDETTESKSLVLFRRSDINGAQLPLCPYIIAVCHIALADLNRIQTFWLQSSLSTRTRVSQGGILHLSGVKKNGFGRSCLKSPQRNLLWYQLGYGAEILWQEIMCWELVPLLVEVIFKISNEHTVHFISKGEVGGHSEFNLKSLNFNQISFLRRLQITVFRFETVAVVVCRL